MGDFISLRRAGWYHIAYVRLNKSPSDKSSIIWSYIYNKIIILTYKYLDFLSSNKKRFAKIINVNF